MNVTGNSVVARPTDPGDGREVPTSNRSVCFHCGLPVEASRRVPDLTVLGEPRAFCCAGCRAVCQTIVDAGLADYYRYRTEQGAPANRRTLPEFLDQLALYDRPEVQKGFVRTDGSTREASLLLEDIRCPACLWLTERHIRRLSGVADVHVDYTTQRARVRWDPQCIRLSDILKAIADIGYIAHPYDPSHSDYLRRLQRRRNTERLLFAGIAGMIVMNFSLATYLMGGESASGLPLWIIIGRWTSLLVTGSILAYPGQEFFVGAWADIRVRRLGMDVPIVIGLSIAMVGSLHATITQRGDVYYDSIAMFVFFVLLARRWEARGRVEAADYMDRLARIVPGSARRLDTAGRTDMVPVAELVPGDRLQLLPGETVPVDCLLRQAHGSFDESLLTGESMPVAHVEGEAVPAGSVNGDQPVVLEVLRPVAMSAISEVQRLVEQGLEARPQSAVVSEIAARWFVAVVLVVAAGTAVWWLFHEPAAWLTSTVAVLIVTCPCALALATPVALAVSAGRLVAMGVLPMRMAALEDLARATVAALDKTGTITAGRPAVVDVVPGALDRESALRHAAALTRHSEHPLARAVADTADDGGVSARSIENRPGQGIAGEIDGEHWRFGAPEFAVPASGPEPEIADVVEALRSRGLTVSALTNPRDTAAVFAFEDPVRAGFERLMQGFGADGVERIVVLSGDATTAVHRVADQLRLREAHGRMSPADKLGWIRQQQSQGVRVLMFGDGINDAPTLAAADVSVSFAAATDLANAHSDFVIVGDSPVPLLGARRLARRAARVIRQNLFWAAAYNLCAIPLAAAGYVPPWGAAIGMSASSLIVVANALRLRRPGVPQSSTATDS